MEIKIQAFKDGKDIPKEYTCDGKDTLPAIQMIDIPRSTVSLTLIIDDPDATGGETWNHCIIYNIHPKIQEITAENMEIFSSGINSWGNEWYGGPCPPEGDEPHQYIFKLYALKKELEFKKPPDAKEIIKAIHNHIIRETVYTGLYKRK